MASTTDVVDLLAHLVDVDDARDAVVRLGPLQDRAHRIEIVGRGAAKFDRFHHGDANAGSEALAPSTPIVVILFTAGSLAVVDGEPRRYTIIGAYSATLDE